MRLPLFISLLIIEKVGLSATGPIFVDDYQMQDWDLTNSVRLEDILVYYTFSLIIFEYRYIIIDLL